MCIPGAKNLAPQTVADDPNTDTSRAAAAASKDLAPNTATNPALDAFRERLSGVNPNG